MAVHAAVIVLVVYQDILQNVFYELLVITPLVDVHGATGFLQGDTQHAVCHVLMGHLVMAGSANYSILIHRLTIFLLVHQGQDTGWPKPRYLLRSTRNLSFVTKDTSICCHRLAGGNNLSHLLLLTPREYVTKLGKKQHLLLDLVFDFHLAQPKLGKMHILKHVAFQLRRGHLAEAGLINHNPCSSYRSVNRHLIQAAQLPALELTNLNTRRLYFLQGAAPHQDVRQVVDSLIALRPFDRITPFRGCNLKFLLSLEPLWMLQHQQIGSLRHQAGVDLILPQTKKSFLNMHPDDSRRAALRQLVFCLLYTSPSPRD